MMHWMDGDCLSKIASELDVTEDAAWGLFVAASTQSSWIICAGGVSARFKLVFIKMNRYPGICAVRASCGQFNI